MSGTLQSSLAETNTLSYVDEEGKHPGKSGGEQRKSKFGYTAPKNLLEEARQTGPQEDPFAANDKRRIADREDKYHQRKRLRMLSPTRHDPFANPDKTPDVNSRGYAGIMSETLLDKERFEIEKKIAKQKEEQSKLAAEKRSESKALAKRESGMKEETKSRGKSESTQAGKSDWERDDRPSEIARPRGKWDTPGREGDSSVTRRTRWDRNPAGSEHDATPGRHLIGETPTPSRFGETPGRFGETPTPKRAGRSRWDDKTPVAGQQTPNYAGITPTPVNPRECS